MNQTTGGVFVAFLGVVLIIAGVNGTLSKTWNALLGNSGGGKGTSPAAPSTGVPVPGSIGIGDLPSLATETTAGHPGSGLTV